MSRQPGWPAGSLSASQRAAVDRQGKLRPNYRDQLPKAVLRLTGEIRSSLLKFVQDCPEIRETLSDDPVAVALIDRLRIQIEQIAARLLCRSRSRIVANDEQAVASGERSYLAVRTQQNTAQTRANQSNRRRLWESRQSLRAQARETAEAIKTLRGIHAKHRQAR